MLTIWYNTRLSSKNSHSSGARFCLSANLSSLHQGFSILTIWYNTRLSSNLPTQVVQGSAYITFCLLSAKLSSLHQGFNMLTLWYNTRLYSKLPTQVVQGGFWGGGSIYIYNLETQCCNSFLNGPHTTTWTSFHQSLSFCALIFASCRIPVHQQPHATGARQARDKCGGARI